MRHRSRARKEARLRRHNRVRGKISGTSERPRLAVYRSHQHIYAQLIDDTRGVTLAAASSLSPEVREAFSYSGNQEAAAVVGRLIGERAREKGIERAVFDRGGYRYHGRVRALADAARQAGLNMGAASDRSAGEDATGDDATGDDEAA